MYGALLALGFGIERATLQTLSRIFDQFAALPAQTPLRRVMLPAAIYLHEGLNHIRLLVLFRQALPRRRGKCSLNFNCSGKQDVVLKMNMFVQVRFQIPKRLIEFRKRRAGVGRQGII